MTTYIYKTIFKIVIILCFIVTNAQVKISTSFDEPTTLDSSTILDITSSNKGFSMTSVALKSEDDVTTIKNPKKGLLVYNTIPSQLKEGIYYNAGTSTNPKWARLESISSVEGTETSKSLGPYSLTRTVKLGHIEARLIENPSDGNKKQVQIRSTEIWDLDYSVIAKQYWVQETGDFRSTRAASGTMTSSFNWVAGVDSLNNDKSELNDIWIYITSASHEGTYRLVINTININGVVETSLILKEY